MAMADDGRVQFRDVELAGWLRDRAKRMPFTRDRRSTDGSPVNGQAKAELTLWRMALEAELGRIRITLAQASCIADVLNVGVLEAALGAPLGLAYAECYDAFRFARTGPAPDVSSYGAKWGPEDGDPAKWEQELLELLGALGPAADFALRDAISRWWKSDGEPTVEGFAAVGLRVTEG